MDLYLDLCVFKTTTKRNNSITSVCLLLLLLLLLLLQSGCFHSLINFQLFIFKFIVKSKWHKYNINIELESKNVNFAAVFKAQNINSSISPLYFIKATKGQYTKVFQHIDNKLYILSYLKSFLLTLKSLGDCCTI